MKISVLHALNDCELSGAIQGADTIVLFRQAYRVILAARNGSIWSAYMGELSATTCAELDAAARDGRLQSGVWPDDWASNRPATIPLKAALQTSTMNQAEFKAALKQRDSLMEQGRGKPLSTEGSRKVWEDGHCRCMYRGCARRLDILSTGRTGGNYGQLAHIVGAAPKGPRGTDQSLALSNEPLNFLLLCYEHHHLIDAIDPDGHTIDDLNKMRARHVDKANALLDSLGFQETVAISIVGGIAGQSAKLLSREIHEALEERELQFTDDLPYEAFVKSDAPRPKQYYGFSTLNNAKTAIQRMISMLDSQGHWGKSEMPLSVFPLHDTPVLVLTGRIVGEARTVHVFQRDRDNNSWKWGDKAAVPDQDFFKIEVKAAPAGATAGLLTIAMSDDYQSAWLSPEIQQQIDNNQITWLHVSAASPSRNVIVSDAYRKAALTPVRDALQALQGKHQVQEVHMIIVAPASVAFGIGQTLQAGNHPAAIVYHRPDFTSPFVPVFRIEGRQVASADPDCVVATITLQAS